MQSQVEIPELLVEGQAYCTPVRLPQGDVMRQAAQIAIDHNPVNKPPVERLLELFGDAPNAVEQVLHPDFLAVLTTKYWRNGVKLAVAFMDNATNELANKILSHANAWGSRGANIQFVLSNVDPQVRIYRGRGGYWSYLGTDILSIGRNQQTMNLEGFTVRTPEREFIRVVRHEFGHTLGYPHEHMRRDIVARLDEQRTIQYFMQTQGWSANEVRQQVLIPLEEGSLLGTSSIADALSIMTYQLPGSITKDGKPIIGGNDINETDYEVTNKTYPGVKPPEPPTKPPDKPPITTMPDRITGAAVLNGVQYLTEWKKAS